MKAAALALVTLVAGGCFLSEDGAMRLTWRVTQAGAVSTCEAVGGVTVRVTATRKSNGDVFKDLFDCADGSGTTFGLRPGNYSVSVELLDKDDQALSQPFSVDVRVTSGDDVPIGDFDFDFAGDAALSVTWQVLINEAPANCSDVGGASVVVDSQLVAGGDTLRDLFPCDKGSGTTDTLPAGSYNVHVSLQDPAGNTLSFVDVQVTVAGGQTKNIGHVEFPFVFRSAGFQAKIGDGNNCSKVVQQEIRVSDMTHSMCLAFPLSDSGTTCTRTACQADNVRQVVDHLAPGQYGIQVFGYKGASGNRTALCYFSDIVDFTVGDSDVELGTIVAPFDASMDPEHLCN